MWAAILRNEETLLGVQERILEFGDLVQLKVDRGIDDANWKPVTAAVAQAQGETLFEEFGESA